MQYNNHPQIRYIALNCCTFADFNLRLSVGHAGEVGIVLPTSVRVYLCAIQPVSCKNWKNYWLEIDIINLINFSLTFDLELRPS